MAQTLILGALLLGLTSALDLVKIEEGLHVQPKPYAFTYTAGRAPGHTDRVHSEVSDGTGVVKGMFSYVDPRQQIRTVEYVADQFGFHPIYVTANQDTAAVTKEKQLHAALFHKIAQEQQQIVLERGQSGLDDGSYRPAQQPDAPVISSYVDPAPLPKDTNAVNNAKAKHFALYDKIAREHAVIASQRRLETPEIL